MSRTRPDDSDELELPAGLSNRPVDLEPEPSEYDLWLANTLEELRAQKSSTFPAGAQVPIDLSGFMPTLIDPTPTPFLSKLNKIAAKSTKVRHVFKP